MKKKIAFGVLIFVAVLLALLGFYAAYEYNLLPQKSYAAEDFGIVVLQSTMDFNGNGIDTSMLDQSLLFRWTE